VVREAIDQCGTSRRAVDVKGGAAAERSEGTLDVGEHRGIVIRRWLRRYSTPDYGQGINRRSVSDGPGVTTTSRRMTPVSRERPPAPRRGVKQRLKKGGRSLLTHDPARDPGSLKIAKLALLKPATLGVSSGVSKGVAKLRVW
jgi:hypothetical protein